MQIMYSVQLRSYKMKLTFEIWAHHTLIDTFFHATGRLGTAHYMRAMHQFGGLLGDKVLSAGIGRRLQVDDLVLSSST